MKKMIFVISVILASCVAGFLVGLSYLEESARENSENDKPCKSLQILKWTSIFSKESKFQLGHVYSRGICMAQDIPLAKDLYTSVYGSDSEKVARALFHDAVQLSDFYERSKKDQKSENIRALLVESKRLGFQPSEREIGDLTERGLKEVFMDSVQQ